jgi:chemotaxis protein methyltransferase CheR
MTEPAAPIWTGDDLSDQDFLAIIDLLKAHRQFDLGQYKDRCIRRRIAKRLRCSGAMDIEGYLECLRSDEDELDALLATLSIHVSQFFRNPDTFQSLESQILPDLYRQAKAAGRQELLLWSAGCAGGEEPYSLALLMDEFGPADLQVKILATDISQPVLATAREGLFESSRLTDVPAPVLQKYFRPENGSYRLIERIREMVVFKQHNIMTATDFPAADLILCRNVLIYFSRDEQDRIFSRFAQALSDFGALVLGRSETISGAARQLFQAEFPVERIYRRVAMAATQTIAAGTTGAGQQGAE